MAFIPKISSQKDRAILVLMHLAFGIDVSFGGIARATDIPISKLKSTIKLMIADGLVTDQGIEDDEDDSDRIMGTQTRIVATQDGVDVLDRQLSLIRGSSNGLN